MISDNEVSRRAGALGPQFDTHVFCVPAGTEIEHEGEVLTVTETNIVWIKSRVYCTQSVFDAIKARSEKRLY